MRSPRKFTISAADVQAVTTGLIQEHLQFEDYSRKCPWWVMLSVLLFAAARRRSIFDACGRLSRAPSDETIRKAVVATLPEIDELQRRVNAALADWHAKHHVSPVQLDFIQADSRNRARCSSTQRFDDERSSSLQIFSLLIPSISRSVNTSAWRCGKSDRHWRRICQNSARCNSASGCVPKMRGSERQLLFSSNSDSQNLQELSSFVHWD